MPNHNLEKQSKFCWFIRNNVNKTEIFSVDGLKTMALALSIFTLIKDIIKYKQI